MLNKSWPHYHFIFLACDWKYTHGAVRSLFCLIVILFKVLLQQWREQRILAIQSRQKWNAYRNHKGSQREWKNKPTITTQTCTEIYCATGYCFAFRILTRHFFPMLIPNTTVVVSESVAHEIVWTTFLVSTKNENKSHSKEFSRSSRRCALSHQHLWEIHFSQHHNRRRPIQQLRRCDGEWHLIKSQHFHFFRGCFWFSVLPSTEIHLKNLLHIVLQFAVACGCIEFQVLYRTHSNMSITWKIHLCRLMASLFRSLQCEHDSQVAFRELCWYYFECGLW